MSLKLKRKWVKNMKNHLIIWVLVYGIHSIKRHRSRTVYIASNKKWLDCVRNITHCYNCEYKKGNISPYCVNTDWYLCIISIICNILLQLIIHVLHLEKQGVTLNDDYLKKKKNS